jgi:hypothetical protein
MGSKLRAAVMSEISQAKDRTPTISKGKAKNPLATEGLQALIIRNHLDGLFKLRDHRDEIRAGLHASSVIASDNEFCYRQQVLSLLYQQSQGENLDPKMARIYMAGDSIHEKWQRLFVKGGLAHRIEGRRFSDLYELFFTPDAEIVINMVKFVVEIKSMNTFSFQKANSHPSGRLQLMLYMHLLGVPNGFILAEDKNTQDYKIFLQQYEYEPIKHILNRLSGIQEMKKIYLKTGELPPRRCKNTETKRAQDCSLCSACFNPSARILLAS